MSQLSVDFVSTTLKMGTRMQVLLPDKTAAALPVLYLLHGLGGDDTQWLGNASPSPSPSSWASTRTSPAA